MFLRSQLPLTLASTWAVQVWDLHRGQWNATTSAMRATSKCNAVDVSHSWKDSKGTNAVVVSGHMDGSVRVGGVYLSLI